MLAVERPGAKVGEGSLLSRNMQGNRILKRQDCEEVIVVPAGPFALGLHPTLGVRSCFIRFNASRRTTARFWSQAANLSGASMANTGPKVSNGVRHLRDSSHHERVRTNPRQEADKVVSRLHQSNCPGQPLNRHNGITALAGISAKAGALSPGINKVYASPGIAGRV